MTQKKKWQGKNDAERAVIKGLPTGEATDVSRFRAPTVRASLIRHILLNPDLYDLHETGIAVQGAHFKDQLDLECAEINHRILLEKCRFEEVITFLQARTRAVSLEGSTLMKGLDAASAVIEGPLFLSNGFESTGEIILRGTAIGGDLACRGATLNGHKGNCVLSADGATVAGSIFLDEGKEREGVQNTGFTAKGEVRFVSATIGGSLVCNGATLDNSDGDYALIADGVKVAGSVFLTKGLGQTGFMAKGTVRLVGASISGTLKCSEAKLEKDDGLGFDATGMTVIGRFIWRNVTGQHGGVDLRGAHVATLKDDEAGWAGGKKLYLDGFTYKGLSYWETEKRLIWLSRQPSKYLPQPYEQLAKVLKESGHNAYARRVLIAKEDLRCKYAIKGFWRKLWHGVLKLTAGYGYEPWRALVGLGLAWYFGTALFLGAFGDGLMEPSKERVFLSREYRDTNNADADGLTKPEQWNLWVPDPYPRFNAFIYSLDTLIPLVDLHQETYYLPNSAKPWGWMARGYFWLHIALGWILTTIAVAGFTGLLKKE